MTKSKKYLIYGGILVLLAIFLYANFGLEKEGFFSDSKLDVQKNNSGAKENQEKKPADKVLVYVFHSTSRCYSCITMGQYTKATLEEFFQPELRDGKIEFKEINVDLPENKEVATKFQAAGSSLFLDAIIDGQDNIKEEVQVWRLLSNKQAFSEYLFKKIEEMI